MPNMHDLLVKLIDGVRGMDIGDPYDDMAEQVAASDVVRWAIAEIERHRMTAEERVAASDAAAAWDSFPDNRAMAVRNYLDRTAPEAART